jgi:hypothetical protein
MSVGMSAALLASLFTFIAASSAFGAVSVTSVGNVPRGGTSTNAATFTFSEETAGCISNFGGGTPNTTTFAVLGASATFSVQIAQFGGGGPGNVTLTGTPVVTAPGIMGATASLTAPTADTLLVKITGSDPINKQQITITGLKIKAKAGAALGAITATLSDVTGTVPHCFLGSTGHPTGTVATAIGSGATSVVVTVPSGATCPFVGSGTIDFGGATPETGLAVSAASAYTGTQTLTIAATANGHLVGDSVTASTACPIGGTIPFVMASPGTVVDVVTQDVGPIPAGSGVIKNVNPGEQNQDASNTWIMEDTAGFIAKTAITFTLSGPGIQFSTSPTVGVFTNAGVADPTGVTTGMTLGSTLCTISFDRTSCTVSVTAKSTVVGGATINLSNIKLDVASTVAAGTAVNVTVTGAGAVLINNQTIAYVARVIVGVAAQPTIYINYNDQASGQLSLTEQGAGFFTDGSVINPNNVFGLCITTDETFTRAPWAVVTVGDLKLLSGLVGATSVQGTLFNGGKCAYWTVYSASTVASTIEIRGSDASNAVLPSGATNGPRYSVPNTTPGATLVNILVGSNATVLAQNGVVSKVSNAVRAFKSGVTVTALSQPTIPAGTADSLGGNIQISETLNGQFKQDEEICVVVLPRASNALRTQDTFLKSANTNDLPIITTNGATGLLVDSVATRGCSDRQSEFSILFGTPADTTNSFSFSIQQQAFGTLGQITISNIHFITTADAPAGAVLLGVAAIDTAGVEFQSIVSNAKIGSQLAGTAATRLGVTQVGAFTTSTKVQKVHKYVTYRFDFGVGAAGQTFKIWGAKKTGNDWSAFSVVTSRVANASGVVYYYIRSSSPAWWSFRAQWGGGGVMTPARQAHFIP